MRLKISERNTKLGKIPNFNLPPVVTCAEGVPCGSSGECYSIQAWVQYPSTRKAWQSNLDFYKEDPAEFFKEFRLYLKKKQPKYFRMFSAGDFPDEVFWQWFRRVAAYTGESTQFLVYTKRYNDWKFEDVPSNVTLVFSTWPGWPLPAGEKEFPFAWLKEDPRRPVDNYFMCKGHCDACFACWGRLDKDTDVIFKRHGKGVRKNG